MVHIRETQVRGRETQVRRRETLVRGRETQVRGREGRPWCWACLPGEMGEAMEDLPFAPAPGASFGLGPVLGELGP